MPRECSNCGLEHPDAVRMGGGTRGVKYCISCGTSLTGDDPDE